MQVYVIKSKQTKEYQTVVMDFIPDIRQSDIFIDYEVALAYCPSDCEIVECELMEKTELADYTKQVRKEVCDKIREWHDEESESLDLDSDFDVGYSGALSNLWGILDQIEGKPKD